MHSTTTRGTGLRFTCFTWFICYRSLHDGNYSGSSSSSSSSSGGGGSSDSSCCCCSGLCFDCSSSSFKLSHCYYTSTLHFSCNSCLSGGLCISYSLVLIRRHHLTIAQFTRSCCSNSDCGGGGSGSSGGNDSDGGSDRGYRQRSSSGRSCDFDWDYLCLNWARSHWATDGGRDSWCITI